MGKIYSGGKNYGESLDDIDSLWISSNSGYYEEDGIQLDATIGYCYISLREDEYNGDDTYTQCYTQIESDQISVEKIQTESGERNTYETQIKPENIVTNDIVRYGGYWGSENGSHSLENTLEYLYSQTGNLPSITSSDNGKALIANDGEWDKGYPIGFNTGYVHCESDDQDITNNSGWGSGTITDKSSLKQVLEGLEEHSLPSASASQEGCVPMVNGYGRWAISALPSDAKDFDNGYIHSNQEDIVMNEGYWGDPAALQEMSLRSALDNLANAIDAGFDNGYMHISDNDVVQDRHVGVNGYWGTEEPLQTSSLRGALSNLATSGSSLPDPSQYMDGDILTVSNEEWVIDRNIAYALDNDDLYTDGTDICLHWGYWGSEEATHDRSLSTVLDNLANCVNTPRALNSGYIRIDDWGDDIYNEYNWGSGYCTEHSSLKDTLEALDIAISDLNNRVTALES